MLCLMANKEELRSTVSTLDAGPERFDFGDETKDRGGASVSRYALSKSNAADLASRPDGKNSTIDTKFEPLRQFSCA
jgi:hypothetical protein